jgi:hypothetical protein
MKGEFLFMFFRYLPWDLVVLTILTKIAINSLASSLRVRNLSLGISPDSSRRSNQYADNVLRPTSQI